MSGFFVKVGGGGSGSDKGDDDSFAAGPRDEEEVVEVGPLLHCRGSQPIFFLQEHFASLFDARKKKSHLDLRTFSGSILPNCVP